MKKRSKVNKVGDGQGSGNNASGFSFIPSFTNVWVPHLVLVFKLWKTCLFSVLKGLPKNTRQHRWDSGAVDMCPELRNKSYSAFHIMKTLAIVFSCQGHHSDYLPIPVTPSSCGKAYIPGHVAQPRSVTVLLPLVR